MTFSTREQFAFLVRPIIANEWTQFSTIYALCFTGVCVAITNSPIVKYLSTDADVH